LNVLGISKELPVGESMEVFVNEQRVALAARSSVRDAVAVFDPVLAETVEGGQGYVTDGVGRKLELDAVVATGSILRVVKGSTPEDQE